MSDCIEALKENQLPNSPAVKFISQNDSPEKLYLSCAEQVSESHSIVINTELVNSVDIRQLKLCLEDSI